jgi:hypothetical protein
MIARIRIEEGQRGFVAHLLGPRRPKVGHEGWNVLDLSGNHITLQLANPHAPFVTVGEILLHTPAMDLLEVDLGSYDHPAARGL